MANPTYFRQIIGSLRYMCNTRQDLSFSVGYISIFMKAPMRRHLLAAKRIMRYIKGTVDYGILFPKGGGESEIELLGYSNSDWCGDKSNRKRTVVYVFLSGGAPVSWCSKKEVVVALSPCEVEYVAASMSACQVVWLDTLMQELQLKQVGVVKLLVDNKFVIDLAKHPAANGRSKHIKTRFHFLSDQVNNDKLVLEYCKTELQVANISTKALKGERYRDLREMLGVVNINAI